ncbi:hypothetical protein FB45DRAFT_932637 [Roridomyces roridus]|uniref:Uncharacterized protein n=1 Tax=Roridomyces roridus TaxID=1738132 RepID=A0AAD7FDM9_9AGAR|nr:hypothetical protein FB45DRAFT_932637 [Roridomyces roridus]
MCIRSRQVSRSRSLKCWPHLAGLQRTLVIFIPWLRILVDSSARHGICPVDLLPSSGPPARLGNGNQLGFCLWLDSRMWLHGAVSSFVRQVSGSGCGFGTTSRMRASSNPCRIHAHVLDERKKSPRLGGTGRGCIARYAPRELYFIQRGRRTIKPLIFDTVSVAIAGTHS